MRYNVESDGTGPNNTGCARKNSTSEHASPPPASVSIACTNTFPRSCNGNRSPAGTIRADNAAPNPRASANWPDVCSPTCATTPSPPGSTRAFRVLVTFICQVPFRQTILVSRNPKNALRTGHLSRSATNLTKKLVNDPG